MLPDNFSKKLFGIYMGYFEAWEKFLLIPITNVNSSYLKSKLFSW